MGRPLPDFPPVEGRPAILLMRRRYFGDIVLLTNMLRNLRLAFPRAWITVVVDDAFAEVLETNPDLSEVCLLPTGKNASIRKRLLAWQQMFGQLLRRRFDLAFDLALNHRARLGILFSRAARRLACDQEEHPLRHRWFYTDVVPVSVDWYRTHHITEMNNLLLGALGIPAPFDGLVLPVKEIERKAMAGMLDKLAPAWRERPLLLVHPGTRTKPRLWPAERFASVLSAVRHQYAILLVGGKSEAEHLQGIQEEFLRSCPGAPPLRVAPPMRFQEMSALFSLARYLLCHDSGPMHVAAAVGTKVVALFSSQPVATWRPLGQGHLSLQTPLPCHCLLPELCRPEDTYFSYCVRKITVEEVLAALASVSRPSRDGGGG